MKGLAFGIGLVAGIICNSADAQGIGPGSSLAGYQCYHIGAEALKLTPEERGVVRGFPRVPETGGSVRSVCSWRPVLCTSPGRCRKSTAS
jgi:hypothetical protein